MEKGTDPRTGSPILWGAHERAPTLEPVVPLSGTRHRPKDAPMGNRPKERGHQPEGTDVYMYTVSAASTRRRAKETREAHRCKEREVQRRKTRHPLWALFR